MQIVSKGDKLYGMSKPIFLGKTRKYFEMLLSAESFIRHAKHSLILYIFQVSCIFQTCAYNTETGSFIESGRSAGTVNRWNRLWFPREYQLEDEKYRHVCCDLAGMCNEFHNVRPTHSCYTVQEFQLGTVY